MEFIRLQFTDHVSVHDEESSAIPAGKLPKAMDDRCIIDASSIEGFIRTEEAEMYLRPDLSTFSILPWRPQQGKGCTADL
ncbi:MAG: glutamine synthetase beta-grasp domain-containing protein [Blautia sp.]